MSKRILGMVCASALSAMLIVTPATAQETADDPGTANPTTPPVTTTDTTDDDEGMDLGWIGLLGLAGLAGLMRRDHNDRHVDRTTTVNR
jgi:MYXO-CTERM domain-containing protein